MRTAELGAAHGDRAAFLTGAFGDPLAARHREWISPGQEGRRLERMRLTVPKWRPPFRSVSHVNLSVRTITHAEELAQPRCRSQIRL